MTHRPVSPATPSTALDPRRWRILALLGVAQLMMIVDVTVVALALPHLAGDLGLGREALTWVVSGYTLTFGSLLLLGGRLSDLVGARTIVVAGLVVFTGASLAAGLADSATSLLTGRVGQGIGAAMLSPAALSLVVTTFDGDERNRALGVWSALGGVGAAVGVLMGGALTGGPGWEWVFFVNVPVGAIALIGLVVMLPRSARPAGPGRIDLIGAVLVTAATGSLIYALVGAGDRGWFSSTTGWLVLAAAVGYYAFAAWQHHTTAPLMDLRLLARGPVTTGVLLVFTATALMIAVFFLGTFYFQNALDYGALHTGLLFLPVAVATAVGANVTGRALARLGARSLGVGGLVVAGVGMAVPAVTLHPATTLIGVVVAGAGTGAVFVVASVTALGHVEPHEAGVASGIVSTFHEFGASVGAAVISSVATASLAGSSLGGFRAGFAVAAGTSIVAASATLALLRTPGGTPAK